MAEQLALQVTGPLLSSPYLRCRQTLEPLGERLGLEVIDDLRLAEGQPFEPALDLVNEAADGTVLCTHGDLLPAVVSALVRRGALLATMPDWRKAVVWELTTTPDPTGERATPIGVMRAWAPPEV
jgi:phosphohistidine phosphatase SixA